MGDVYRARDTRLDRVVALKISKEQFTLRFETEARATAALEHPHICRLYDICHEAGPSFLVMEYVDGKPLEGPLPLDRVLTYAGQIAPRRAPWAWIPAGVVAAGLASVALVHFREAPPRSELVTFQIAAPENRTIASEPFLSPDGRSVALVAAGLDGVRSIAVRPLAALATRSPPRGF